ncbi:alpha/beta fold hydrolase [Streptomyces sp. NBC_01089]|uniref:alpha/beta fold hydrolase n=1 Tax=Streptomyces sp. NBC_01089 TaxID=2903747 RepID=UPI0038665F44|nr:hypothetical protein OG510_11215 [Streptomyces sp. NBC_01089]
MELGEFARALEVGELTPLQWSELLSSDFHRRQWNLLHRLHADEVLRNMFPSLTHGSVRLRVDALDATSRQVLVHELSGERYEVINAEVPGADWDGVSTGDLIAYLRDSLEPEGWRFLWRADEIQAAKAAVRGDWWDDFTSAKQPLMVVRGSHSPVVPPRHAEEMIRRRPGTIEGKA